MQYEGGLAEWLQLHATKVAAEERAIAEAERGKRGRSSHEVQGGKGGGGSAHLLDRFDAALSGIAERFTQPISSAPMPPEKAGPLQSAAGPGASGPIATASKLGAPRGTLSDKATSSQAPDPRTLPRSSQDPMNFVALRRSHERDEALQIRGYFGHAPVPDAQAKLFDEEGGKGASDRGWSGQGDAGSNHASSTKKSRELYVGRA